MIYFKIKHFDLIPAFVIVAGVFSSCTENASSANGTTVKTDSAGNKIEVVEVASDAGRVTSYPPIDTALYNKKVNSFS